jgi:hypothetical protein
MSGDATVAGRKCRDASGAGRNCRRTLFSFSFTTTINANYTTPHLLILSSENKDQGKTQKK